MPSTLFRNLLISAACALALTACSDDSESLSTQTPESPEKLYTEARDMLDQKEYKDSIKAFDEVERQHPESKWATHSQIMAAYSAYKSGDYDQAIAMLERFTKMHPGHESTPYAYYLIALSYYERISDVGRDQKMTEDALQSLSEVVRRFPDSSYARDAKLKLDLTYDHLAGKDMEIGRYYQKRDEYISAINRFRFVVENYQSTSHIPEALHRLTECYLRLGVTEEARRYASVLGHNFPDSEWYQDSYGLLTGEKPEEKGWIDKVW